MKPKKTLRQEIYRIDDPVEPPCGGNHPNDYIHSSDGGASCCLWCESLGQELRLREKILKLESYVRHDRECRKSSATAYSCDCQLINVLES